MKKIKTIFLDVDWVLTDWKITYSNSLEEFKSFNIKDWLAIKSWLSLWFEIFIITWRESLIVKKRCKELWIKDIFQWIQNKKEKILQLIKNNNLKKNEIAYIWDDLNDLWAIWLVWFSATPNDWAEDVKNIVNIILEKNWWEWVVREFVEKALKEKWLWVKILKKYN